MDLVVAPTIALNTAEAETIAGVEAVKQVKHVFVINS